MSVDPSVFTSRLVRVPEAVLGAVRPYWGDLPLDPYLEDGSRSRRLTRFRVDGETLVPLPAEPVSQSKRYNPDVGGLPRSFVPLDADLVAQPEFHQLARAFLEALPLDPEGRILWVHQIRVTCEVAGGRPTPEGIHRDEREYLGILVVEIEGLACGATRLYPAMDAPPCYEAVLEQGDLLVFRDEVLFHSTDAFSDVTGAPGHRDTILFALTKDPSDGTPRATPPARVPPRRRSPGRPI